MKTSTLLQTALGAIMLLLFSGCAHRQGWVSVPKNNGAVVHDSAVNASTKTPMRRPGSVAPGYLVGISSPDPKVNGEYRVDFDGSLKLPYKVQVQAAGLDQDKLQDQVRRSYAQYFKAPNEINVSVRKKEYLVQAQGLVNKPGRYVLKRDGTLDDLIAQAGGLLNDTDPSNAPRYARITGNGEPRFIRLADYHAGAIDDLPEWTGGETVFFQTQGGAMQSVGSTPKNTVQVLGQVRAPAEYVAEKDGNFFSYLVKAGGPTDRADLGSVTLIRTTPDSTDTLSFNAHDAEHIPAVLPGDTIIINSDVASPLEKKSRIGASFANIISAIGIIIIAATT